jgi:dTMP kinase
MSKGFFITLEGIEGCGKTTQAKLLGEYLKEKGREVVSTREPGGTAIGKRVREILLDPKSAGMDRSAELLLYFADRAQHVAQVIEPALTRGAVVICDRFTDATAAYQGFGRDVDMDTIADLAEAATHGLTPDLTLLLDLPVQEGLKRARKRNGDNKQGHEGRFEEEPDEFHEKVRQGYLTIASCEMDRFKIIDASGTVEEIQAAIRKVVTPLLSHSGK